jgi:hypothetical protein
MGKYFSLGKIPLVQEFERQGIEEKREKPVGKSRPVWKPQKIDRFIKNFPTAAGTILVKTDLGEGYLKAMGNPGGEHCLACEYVGTQLAKWFGLATFEFALIQVTNIDNIPFKKGSAAKAGPAFITRKERGQAWSGSERQLKKLVNKDDLTLLVIFDTWTLNWDRYSVDEKGKQRINRDNVFLSEEAPAGQLLLKAMDFTHVFTKGGELTAKVVHLDKVKESRLYGLFPQFLPFLSEKAAQRGIARLNDFTKADAEKIVQSIPKEWDVSQGARKALVDFLVQRASYLSQRIMTMLWPQGDLGFKVEGEEQP